MAAKLNEDLTLDSAPKNQNPFSTGDPDRIQTSYAKLRQIYGNSLDGVSGEDIEEIIECGLDG